MRRKKRKTPPNIRGLGCTKTGGKRRSGVKTVSRGVGRILMPVCQVPET